MPHHDLLSCRAKPCSLPSDHGSIPIYLVGTTSFSLLKAPEFWEVYLESHSWPAAGALTVKNCYPVQWSRWAPATQKTSYASSHVIPGLLYLHCQLAHCRPRDFLRFFCPDPHTVMRYLQVSRGHWGAVRGLTHHSSQHPVSWSS